MIKKRAVKKADLPTKPCKLCGKPMTWRKRWEKNWEEVKFCSERCRRNRKIADDKQT